MKIQSVVTLDVQFWGLLVNAVWDVALFRLVNKV